MFTQELIDYFLFWFFFPSPIAFLSDILLCSKQSYANNWFGGCCQIKTLKKIFVSNWTKTLFSLKYFEFWGIYFYVLPLKEERHLLVFIIKASFETESRKIWFYIFGHVLCKYQDWKISFTKRSLFSDHLFLVTKLLPKRFVSLRVIVSNTF